MKLVIIITFFTATFLTYTEALNCWTCETQPSNSACQRTGRVKVCQKNQGRCQNEVRRFQNRIEVSKRCKQAEACSNNELQNSLVGIGAPTISQCTSQVQDSTCRCCCESSLCNNKLGLECFHAPPPPVARCQLPVIPRNGFRRCDPEKGIDGNQADVGVICRFGCDKGLTLIGATRVSCIKSGAKARFDRRSPSCLRRRCNPPRKNPTNGKVQCTDGNNARSICSYTCNSGYSVQPGTRISTVCTLTRRWTYTGLPRCNRVLCFPFLRNPRRGKVSCTNRNFLDSECSFTCDAGYLLEGSPSVTCKRFSRSSRYGTWSGRIPVCKRIRCLPAQAAPSSGSVSCTNRNSEGSVCSFSCDAGYFLDGSSSTTCEDDGDRDDDGVWSNSRPTCVRITCAPTQKNPKDGKVTCGNRNFFGSTCSFTCDTGFFLEGPSSTTCQDQNQDDARGEWSVDPPTCSRITCAPTQVNPKNGDVTCSNRNNLNSVCRFECQEGFAIVGESSISCGDDADGDDEGVWSGPAPTCGQIVCNPPHTAPEDGFVSCINGNNYGSECSFRCAVGFSLVGSLRSVCQTGMNGDIEGEWSSPAPTCVQVICNPPRTDPANGAVACSDVNFLGSVCRYTCNDGYFLSGSLTSTCTDDGDGDRIGEWSGAPPACLRIVCNPPFRDLENGKVECGNGNLEGSVCSFSCEENYFLNGASTSTCEDDEDKDEIGKWSNELPTCVRVTCVPPRLGPQNGGVSCTNRNNAGSICRYSCDTGYVISSNILSSTTCQDDGDNDELGEWSQPPPTCIQIKCSPAHTNPNNGQVSCSNNNNFGSECIFTCDFGFYLRGNSTATCEDDGDGDEEGVWSTAPPVCRRVICNPPHLNPTNGKVTCSRRNRFASLCQYECDSGFFLSGSDQSICQDDRDGDSEGVWSALPPACVRITCSPAHKDPTNGAVSCSNQNYNNSICSFTCNDGFFLGGISTSTCIDNDDNDADGIWNNPAPTCVKIICNPPRQNPINGSVSCSDGNSEDSICTYTCDDGFFLDGLSTTTCQDDNDDDNLGLWSNPPPVCVRITCSPSYDDLLNGGVSCSDGNNQGSVCSFTCTGGYFLDGSSTTTCVDDSDNDAQGTWNQQPPTCVRITCAPPHTNPTNGSVDCTNSNSYQSVCSFTCQPTFFLAGESTSTCQDDLDGDALGVWSSPAAVCVAITCNPSRTNPNNGQVTCTNGNILNSQCTYLCDLGYFLAGSDSTTCQDDNDGDDDGVWSSAPPVCVRITCSPPHSNPRNGTVQCSNSNSFGSACSFTCNDGFFLDGISTSTCVDDENDDADGTWNNPAPTCVRIICNPPRQSPINGSVSCSDGNSEDSVCTYTCDDGFFLDGLSTTTCQDDNDNDNLGLWNNPPPVCVRITCSPSYDDLLNGEVSCSDGNNQGSVCSFTCTEGYFLDGSSTTTCVDDSDNDAQGTWTQQPPTCVRITCPPPHTNPTNGSVDCSNNNFYQSVCSFACDAGYFLDGESSSTCQDDLDGNALGVWNSPAAVCVAITCNPSRTNPNNGQVTCTNGNVLNSRCTYECDVGYFLDGQNTATCQDDDDNDADGLWSSEPPACVRITCNPPHVNPRNGVVACSDLNNYNSTCGFTCNDGFFLGGISTSTCIDDDNDDADGTWNNPAPTCVRIICNPPRQNPINGSVTCSDGNSEDSVCTYTCDDGFFLDGLSTTTCQDDNDDDNLGLWNNPPPVCVRITCSPSYEDLLNGGVSCSDGNNQGSVCSFTCTEGYFLDGSSTTTCVDDSDNDAQGTWTQQPPTCVRITCPPPHTNPTNGSVDCSNNNFYQSVCSFACDAGYFLDGESSSTCQDDLDGNALGVWNSPAAVCVAITCNPSRTNPNNGQVTCTNGNVLNSRCTYECGVGYFLDGQNTATCQDDDDNDADGVWSSEPPACVRITCNPPHVNPRNGVVACSDLNNYNSTCGFACNDGFFLGGISTSTCIDNDDNDADGIWNNPAPTCVRIICNPPRQNPINGSVRCSDGNSEDSVCTYNCDDGFFLDGLSITTCQDDNDNDNFGLWSNPPPVCVRITCSPSYDDLLNGGVSCSDGNNQGSVCSFTCTEGYFLDGSSTTTCVDDSDNDAQGTWNQQPPTCVRVTCPPPHTNPTNGSVDCSNSNFYQSVCSFSCQPEYFLDGESSSTCQDDLDGDAFGVWNSPAAVCVAITCNPSRTNPNNGQVTCTNRNFLNSRCIYECDVGYFLDGQNTATCQDDDDNDADGLWSSEPPACVRITCNPPHVNPVNGSVLCSSSNFFESICSFTCDNGFFLDGAVESTCFDDDIVDANGIWDNSAPVCREIICNPPRQDPLNGTVSCSNQNKENSVCRYTCDDGFFLDGFSITTCQDDNDNDNLGLWNNPPPVCVRITCSPSYDDLLNGGVSCSDGNNQGSVCGFTCTEGYFLDGSSTTTCVDDSDNDAQGTWTQQPPTCVRITCPPPHTNPTNGSVDCSNNNFYQSVCSFTCQAGYFLDGQSSSTCQDDLDGDSLGVWSSVAPFCVLITCKPSRTNPNNGRVSCTNRNLLNSQCTYQCDVGYFLDGQNTATCQDDDDNDADGVWSSEPPACVRITCNPPHVNPRNGVVACSDLNNYNSTCSFACNDGYFRNGVVSSVCIDDNDNDADGTWNNPAPTCVRIICNPPRQSPINGSVSCSDGNSEDSVCTYNCDDGFFLDGLSITTCQDDNDSDNLGLWSNPPPVCVRITCLPSYNDLLNGGVSCSDENNQGSVCSFTCTEGYFLDGSSTTTCVDDSDNDAQGTWTQQPPTCVRVTCPPPHTNPTNGSVDCSNSNFYQSVCSFTCQAGYFLDGQSSSTCQDDLDGDSLGVWSSVAPFCVLITCKPSRTNPDNGRVSCTNRNLLNSQCTYECGVGYFLDGQNTATCQDDDDNDADGVWSSEPPACVRITCNPPHVNPRNGVVACSDLNNYNSRCSFACNDGYFRNGVVSSVCIDEDVNDAIGTWNNPAPTCVRIICNPPRQSPINGSVSCSDGNNEDSVCTYNCDDGFFLDGLSTTTCQDDNDSDNLGLWSNPPPVCVRITCSPSYDDLLNGGVSCSDGNNQGSVCSFTCTEGYFLDGSSTTTCVDDSDNDAQGTWTQQPPTCVRITCPPPHTNPTNGSVDCSDDINYDSVCSFTCQAGYFLDGQSSSTCQDDLDGDSLGVWSSVAPFCVLITCEPSRTNPNNGRVSCTNRNLLNSQCTYQCDADYFLDGQNTATCQDDDDNDADGVWSSEPPACVRITCIPPHPNPTNGAVLCSNENYNNSMCFFTCNDGYFLDGQIQSICVDDNNNDAFGSWTNTPPTCSRIVCNPPRENPQNGSVECTDSNNLDSSCAFTCEPDFFLVGQAILTCVDEETDDNQGSWSAASPVCQHIQCTQMQTDPENGRVLCSNRNFAGSVCRFSCNTNYYTAGSSQITCIGDQSTGTGSWSQATPTCEKVTCVPSQAGFGNGTATCTDDNFVGSVCTFVCGFEYRIIGPTSITCNNGGDGNQFGEWSEPAPVCERITCEPPFTSVENGTVDCFGGNFVNAECEVSCNSDDFRLDGSDYLACVGDETVETGGVAIWTDPFPRCIRKQCTEAPEAPENGARVCSNGNFLNSRCEYVCNAFHKRVGARFITCQEVDEETFSWNAEAPICQAVVCPSQTIRNGRVDCDDPSLIASTECTFSCNQRYVLFPPTVNNNTCLIDSSWSVQAPCCAKICPPNANMDLVILIDSSTSINELNWMNIQSFAKSMIEIFDVGQDEVHFAIARYGRGVDNSTLVRLNQFPNNKTALFNAIDDMRYLSGSDSENQFYNGTFTGRALRFVRNTLFAPENGNRPGSQDVILLITDGRAQDDVETISRQLRNNGVLIYVLGVYPPQQRIGYRQMLQIAGDRNNIVLPSRGFSDLNERLALEISKDFCPLPCTD